MGATSSPTCSCAKRGPATGTYSVPMGCTVAADALAQVLRTVTDPDQAAADLVALAIDGGGPDNVSCIVADVAAREEPAEV